MPAIPPHDTGVVDGKTFSRSAAMMAAPKTAQAMRSMHAWVDPRAAREGKQDQSGMYKLPHHDRPGGPANLHGVRAALSRLAQAATDIPTSDVPAVRRHLEAHLEKGK